MKVDPEKQFVPSQKNMDELVARYGLAFKNFDAATTGIENTTIITDCDEGKLVFRIYRKHKKSDDHIEQEIQFMNFLRSHGVQVPRTLKNDEGDYLTMFFADNVLWQVIAMEFVEGIHPAAYSPALIQNMASLQARLHNISAHFSDSYQSLAVSELKEQQFIKHIAATELENTRLGDFLNRAKEYAVTLADELPRGLCHLDFDKGNILVNKNDEITSILDFDDLANMHYVVDLGYSLWSVWYINGVTAASKYLLLYEQTRELNSEERAFLHSAILFRHYVICALSVLDGEVDDEHVDKYIELENDIKNTSLF